MMALIIHVAGSPSGVDNTVCTHGGAVHFKHGTPVTRINRARLPAARCLQCPQPCPLQVAALSPFPKDLALLVTNTNVPGR